MKSLTRHLHPPLFSEAFRTPIVFRAASIPADGAYPVHRHTWGEFVYSFSGVIEVRIGARQYLAPPQYGIWLPPDVEHQGLNRYEACHSSLYVAATLCEGLPHEACALTVSPLVRAMLEHLREHPPQWPHSAQDGRLLQVVVDQLGSAARAGSYLPTTEDPLLGAVLAMLEADPGDTRSVAQLAQAVHTTERTLVRRCQRELGMSLSEWRQRLRVVKAMPLLEAGEKIEAIALDLGYGSASAFIAMFRRLMGVTPDEYRRQAQGTV
ncbi:MAG TPA: helix-turn-helix transcriptional regulator [Noviherbaspirillum sp.]|nr:helix-turn-helix transcriptional regulator [Noviherbaspirillum sp.]